MTLELCRCVYGLVKLRNSEVEIGHFPTASTDDS